MAGTYFRNVETQAVRKVEKDSPEYRRLQVIKTGDSRFPLYEEVTPQQAAESETETVQKLETTVPASAAAGTAQDQVVGEAPEAGRVVSVSYTPEANITGAATNFRTFRLVNKGQDGNGSTLVASLAFSSGAVTADDFDEKVITLTGVTADRNVAAGDILAWDETVAGTGLSSPGGKVQVEIARGTAA